MSRAASLGDVDDGKSTLPKLPVGISRLELARASWSHGELAKQSRTSEISRDKVNMTSIGVNRCIARTTNCTAFTPVTLADASCSRHHSESPDRCFEYAARSHNVSC